MKKYFFIFFVIFLAIPLFSFKTKTQHTKLDELVYIDKYLRVVETYEDSKNINESFISSSGVLKFLQENPKDWYVLIDKRRGVPSLIDGGAIPFIPGNANNLKFEDFASGCNSNQCIPKEKVEEIARQFLSNYLGLFPVKQEEILIDQDGTIPIGDSIYFLRFQWYYNGIPVEKGSIYFRISNGNLIQVASENIAQINLDPNPSLSKADAFNILQNYLGKMAIDKNDKIINDGSLYIIPVTKEGYEPDIYTGPIGSMSSYKLVYRFIFTKAEILGTWEALIDAHSGQLLRFVDINRYGKIQGGTYTTDKNPTQTEMTMPFPYADYGSGLYSDIGGNFPGLTGTSTLTGRTGSAGNVGSVDINDNCGAISLSSDANGLIDFGTSGGTDCTTPGFGGAGNTHSSRTQFYNVNWIKIKGYTYLSGNTWLQGVLTDNVNLNQTCNAYWDGTSVNFFRSGGGCGNTGELPGVSLHEWGHGMDDNDGSGGDSPPVETRADWTAILQTRQSCAGGGFFVTYNSGCGTVPPPGTGYNCRGYGDCCLDCSGVRDADWDKHQSHTPWTAANHGTVWNNSPGSYNGPCGWEDHGESGIATQALWDLAVRDLPTYCGMDTTSAWQLVDRLWYSSMPQLGNMYSCTPPNSNGCGGTSLFNLFKTIDDDGDGTANGTPHAQGIFQAFARHNIACGNASDQTNQNQTSCPSLSTPNLSGTIGSNSNNLSWDSIPNATRYFIYRNDVSCDSGFTKIATVTAPTTNYTDTTASNGITSYYRIQAATDNDSCVSAMSNCIELTPQTCEGSIILDKNVYNCADTVQVTVIDSTVTEPVQVSVWSTTDGTQKTITLINNSPGSGNYTGTFTTTTSATPGPTEVRVSHNDTIYIRYTDPDYCGTPNVDVDLTSQIDCLGPVITNVHSDNVTGTSADILWNTDEPSDSTVIYDTATPPVANSAFDGSLMLNHNVHLTGLSECTTYYYYVKSKDEVSNETQENNSGNFYTFETGVNVIPTYNSTDVPKPIPDPGTVTSVINVSDNKIIQDVNVTIGDITHTYDGDLDIFLIAPDNTRVELSTDNGSGGDNYINTVFDDEASTSITSGTAPFTGSFRPETSLSVLDGKNAQGVWTLEITDDATQDTGTLNSWSITFTYPAQSCGPSLEYQSSTFTDTCNGTGSGGGDGIIDAGEDILLEITLHNNGTSGTTGISATLSSTTPGVTITDNYATFPDIPADGTGNSLPDHFSFYADESFACGTTLDFTLNITSNEGTWNDTFSLTVGQIVQGGGTVLDENFAGGIPATWTVIDGGSGGGAAATWTTANPGGRTPSSPIATPFAIVDSDYAGSGATQDEQLITPVLDLSIATTVTLEFDQYFNSYSGNEYGDVDVRSSLTGGNWVNVFRNHGADSPNPDHQTIDITAQASGASDVQIRFYYYDASYDWYWMVDNVKVSYTAPGGCNMNLCTGVGGCLNDLGDPSENGTISSVDASLILQYVSGLINFTPSQECKADVNESSSVSAVDGSYTLQCAAGLCASLPPNFLSSCQAHGNCP